MTCQFSLPCPEVPSADLHKLLIDVAVGGKGIVSRLQGESDEQRKQMVRIRRFPHQLPLQVRLRAYRGSRQSQHLHRSQITSLDPGGSREDRLIRTSTRNLHKKRYSPSSRDRHRQRYHDKGHLQSTLFPRLLRMVGPAYLRMYSEHQFPK